MTKSNCPLCGGVPTKFLNPLSDTVELPFESQRCYDCELPCKHWEKIVSLVNALNTGCAGIEAFAGLHPEITSDGLAAVHKIMLVALAKAKAT